MQVLILYFIFYSTIITTQAIVDAIINNNFSWTAILNLGESASYSHELFESAKFEQTLIENVDSDVTPAACVHIYSLPNNKHLLECTLSNNYDELFDEDYIIID